MITDRNVQITSAVRVSHNIARLPRYHLQVTLLSQLPHLISVYQILTRVSGNLIPDPKETSSYLRVKHFEAIWSKTTTQVSRRTMNLGSGHHPRNNCLHCGHLSQFPSDQNRITRTGHKSAVPRRSRNMHASEASVVRVRPLPVRKKSRGRNC